MTKSLLVGLLLVAIALVWWHRSDDTVPAPPAVQQTPSDSSLPVASVLRVRPASPNRSPSKELSVGSLNRGHASPALAQFRDRLALAALYRSIEAGAPTPESLYLSAEIYAMCARGGTSEQAIAERRASDRAKFMAAVQQSGGQAEQRIDAFDRLGRDPCEGLDLGKFDREELARRIAAAAEAGDPRARAWQLAARIEGQYYAAQRVDRSSSGYQLGATDFEQARELLASGDPGVIEDLKDLLASSLQHGTVQLAGQPIDQSALHSALTLLACDAGARCGPDSPALLRDCAYRNRCAAGTVSESMFYYDTSPAQAQLIDQYHRALLAMMNAGDFSGLTLANVDRVPGYSMVFGGHRVVWPDDDTGSEPSAPPPKSFARNGGQPVPEP